MKIGVDARQNGAVVQQDRKYHSQHRPRCTIYRAGKVVTGANGEVACDKPVIAAGPVPFIVPVPGRDLPGVRTCRNLDDTEAMIAACRPGARPLVIGGGLLALEARGIRIDCTRSTKAILGTTRVEVVEMADCTVYSADLVCMAVGIRPETRLARKAGLNIGRRIRVCGQMMTTCPGILALGECVEHDGQLIGHLAPL